MITSFEIANFKAFGDNPQSIPLKPLTIVLGPNSSGKSSILHSLLFAHHAMTQGELDVIYPILSDQTVDLGGFQQFIHGARRGLTSRFTWTARCAASDLAAYLDKKRSGIHRHFRVEDTKDWELLFDGMSEVELSLTVGIPRDDKGNTSRSVSPRVERIECRIDAQILFSAFAVDDRLLKIDQLATDHLIVERISEKLAMIETFTVDISHRARKHALEAIDKLVPRLAIETDGFMPNRLLDSEATHTIDAERSIRKIESASMDEIDNAIRRSMPRLLNELLAGITYLLRADISSMKYLGPLRSYPPRHMAFSEVKSLGTAAGGGAAWTEVAQNHSIRTKVNEWLGNTDKLKTPYQLKLRDYYTLMDLESTYSDSLYDAIYEVIATLHEEIDESWLYDLQEAAKAKEDAQRACFDEGTITEDVMVSRTDPFYQMIDNFLENHTNIDLDAWAWKKRAERKTKPSSSDLILEDQRTKTEVSHRDVGIGISQVLPVLVTAYASQNQILAIEQPEIHLHPALQAELADVFIESAMGDTGNRFLLETHSEHLILRVLRRIRESSRADNPTIRPEDVCVLYVHPKESGSVIMQMRISKDGQFLDPWPGGFFPERMKEMMGA
jgi:predicted ATPase